MPVFEFTYNAAAAPGQSPVTPQAALQFLGPRIQGIQIAIPSRLEQQLRNSKQPVPSPNSGDALIDTGATVSGVDDSVIRRLGVSPVGLANVGTGAGPNQQNLCPARFILPNLGFGLEFSRALGSNLSSTGLIALLGRDVLSRMVFIYSGVSGRITIAF